MPCGISTGEQGEFMQKVYVLITVLFIAIYIKVHLIASFSFPVPWTDEAYFLWQAVAFQQHSTLYAPELNPYRCLYGHTPGHMIVSGLLFKIIGFSLSNARSISLVLVALTFVLLSRIWKMHGYPFFVLILSGMFLLNKYFIVLGNVSRPEALLVFLIALSLYLFQKDVVYKGLTILLV